MLPTCSVCHKHYWPRQQWIHDKCAINGAINNDAINAINSKPAINEDQTLVLSGQAGDSGSQNGLEDAAGGQGVGRGDRTANRRSREAYNAYMRVKMREYRAKK